MEEKRCPHPGLLALESMAAQTSVAPGGDHRVPNPEGQPLSLAPVGHQTWPAQVGSLRGLWLASRLAGMSRVVSVVVARLCSGTPFSIPTACLPEGFSRAPRDGAEREGT